MLSSTDWNNKIKQLFFLAVLVFLFVFLFFNLIFFVPALLGAVTFYILLRKWMNYLVESKKWKNGLAAGFLLFLSFLVILLPIGLTILILSGKVNNVIKNSKQIFLALNDFVHGLEQKLNITIFSNENSQKVSVTIAETVANILNASLNSIITIAVMYFILYFMLMGRRQMENWIYEYLPIKNENVKLVGKEMNTLVFSNAIGIPLVAILQGVTGIIGYAIVGVDDLWFWFIFTSIASMVPFVGSMLAYVPLSLVLLYQNETGKGIIILIYGLAIIGSVDNVFRFILAKKLGDVHPLITVFGVIIGLNLFGFIGLIFGPILISMFILLIKVYMNEFIFPKTPAEEQLEI